MPISLASGQSVPQEGTAWGTELGVVQGTSSLSAPGRQAGHAVCNAGSMSETGANRPTIVCICGSTRRRAEILEAVRAETLAGRIAMAPGVFSQADGEVLDQHTVDELSVLHREKIALADEILIVDVGGVVGDATAAEARHAAALGKPLRYWSEEGPASRASVVDPVVALRECHHVQRLAMNEVPTLDVPDEIKALRCALVEEEAAELRAALDADDIVEVADAVADLLYVVYGAALTFGIPVGAVFSEVHRSNMTKLDDAGEPIMRADGKVVKGPNFSPPDLLPVLCRHGYEPL